VTFANWLEWPNLRWSFQHVARFVPTARVWRGEGPPSRLEERPRDLEGVHVSTHTGEPVPLSEFLEHTCTDGLLVLHEGRVVAERYFNGMRPHTRHLLMSVSKSVAGTLAGVVIGRGLVSPDDLVADVVPELRGTSFEGATVRHVLDMRTGTAFNEDYEDPESDSSDTNWVADWGPPPPGEQSQGMYAYVPTLGQAREHGGVFEYRSILTDVLGWVLECAAGKPIAQLLSDELWSPLGPEEDAEITVDRHGGAWVDGGICTTLRDLARLGQMYLQDGAFNGRQIVPAAWVWDTRNGQADSREAFAASGYADRYPTAFYRSQWWVIRPEDGVYLASGIHGQFLYINVPAQVVVAKFSTLRVASDDDEWLDQIALFDAIAAAL
jgi:CubicO group peptidase (beta-lactamase class C family)